MKQAHQTALHMQLHSSTYLGTQDYTSPIRRRFFASLNNIEFTDDDDDVRFKSKKYPCPVTSALAYDAALVAKRILESRSSPKSSRVISGDGAEADG
jgi:hypothetical protein